MTADMVISLESTKAHLIPPSLLIIGQMGKLGIMVVDAAQRAAFVPVQIIDDSPKGLWLKGLSDNITLITVGGGFVKPGQLVHVVHEDQINQSRFYNRRSLVNRGSTER